MTRRPLMMRAAMIFGAFCAAVLVAGTPASAQEDNFTEQLLTTLGLVAPPPPDIDYRERAPLVVPPSGDTLPPPRDASAITQNPAWPKDEDVERRKEAQKASNKNVNFSDRVANRALTPAEVARGTNPNLNSSNAPGTAAPNEAQRPDWLKPGTGGLGFLGWGKKDEKPMVFAGEPERETLYDPPPGYLTPAPNAAYGVVADRPEDKEWSLPDWFTRSQRNNDRH